jgi:hypothetical protein
VTTVTVVNENRTISINSNHQFVDNFATGLTVHIYQDHRTVCLAHAEGKVHFPSPAALRTLALN